MKNIVLFFALIISCSINAQNILGKSNSVSAFQGLDYKTHPLYTGVPWFVPMVGTWYRFRDWLEEKIDNTP